tara:strand:+ start:234 stop:1037 length:804 start_codon:yes stop_codon:yes gene_type:complete
MIVHGVKNAKLISLEISRNCSRNKPYVEVGIFKGDHLILQALQNPKIPCIGIDNFSLFDKNSQNFKIIKKKLKLNNINNVKIISLDFEVAVKALPKNIGVLFIDAAHDYRSQLITLLKYEKFLVQNGTIVVDDANYFHVRKASEDFIDTHKNYSLSFQKYTTSHVANSNRKDLLLKGYHNGIHIIKKNNSSKLKVKFQKNKKLLMQLFPQSHEVFRHYFSFNAHKILDLVYDFKKNKDKEVFLKKILNIKNKRPLSRQIKYKSQNIF